MSALVFQGVTYGQALSDFNLDLDPGETVVLSGGVGKFQLLRMALGLVHPDAGRVETLGEDPSALAPTQLRQLRARCALVPHTGALISNTSVRMNVALPVRYHDRMPEEQVDGRVNEVLAELDLAGFASMRPSSLTYPQRRLVALARARAMAPELLLLQDPYEGMNERMSDLISRVLGQMGSDGCTTLIATGVTQLRTTYGGRLSERYGARVVAHVGVASAQ